MDKKMKKPTGSLLLGISFWSPDILDHPPTAMDGLTPQKCHGPIFFHIFDSHFYSLGLYHPMIYDNL